RHHPAGGLEIAHRMVVDGRLAPGAHDLVAHLGGRVLGGVLPAAVEPDPDVVDHHLGPLGRQAQGHLAPDAPSRPGHERHPAVEQSHPYLPTHAGGRFSAKAFGPSLASSLPKTSLASSDSIRY